MKEEYGGQSYFFFPQSGVQCRAPPIRFVLEEDMISLHAFCSIILDTFRLWDELAVFFTAICMFPASW
jgi:hypothetical protein